MTESKELFETVIKNNYCIGCGACSQVANSPFSMEYDEYGNIIAKSASNDILNSSSAKVLEICPFSGHSKNEDQLSELLLAETIYKDSQIGRYNACYAGYVNKGEYRKKGSSGGILKWVATKLMEDNHIDYFIQLSSENKKDSKSPLFRYQIFDKADQIIDGSKSSYYPVTMATVLKTIKEKKGRYAITGIPCFIKAIRLLSGSDAIIKSRIKYTLGIICGGMKSANQSKMIGWQLGVHPNDLSGIDFRRKYKNRPADQKIYEVWSNKDKKERYKDVNKIYGSDYGAGFFKPKACDYCDDVVSELADISVGDAWLNRFTYDPKGTSLVISRNKVIDSILTNAVKDDEINLSEVSADEVIQAQAGGFRHRREGLSYRLLKKESNNEWYPAKRVKSGQFSLNEKRKIIYDLREKISEQSHLKFKEALDEDDLNIFYKEMNGVFKEYSSLNEVSRLRLILRSLKRFIYYDILRKYQ